MPTLPLTTQEFKEKIFDYTQEKDWVHKGQLPTIIDFYADWCAPCKMLSPVLEELADEYTGKILVYKVNTDTEKELATLFGIRSVPSILFIPAEDEPFMEHGALPKYFLQKIIEEDLHIQKTETGND